MSEQALQRMPENMELTVVPPTHVEDLPALMQLASQLVPTGFLPDHIKTPGQAVAIILSGRELGIGPMLALRSIYMVKGKIELSADLQLSLFKRDGGKAVFECLTELKATLKLIHPNGDSHTESFTTEDAKRAGLSGDNWRKYPKAMLRSRVITAGLKSLGFEPKMSGCYAPGEIGGPEIVDCQTLEQMEAEKLALQQKEMEAAKATKPNGKTKNHPEAVKAFITWLYEQVGAEIAGWAIPYLQTHTPDGDDKNASLMLNEDLTALSESSLASIRRNMAGFLERLKAFAEQNKLKEKPKLTEQLPLEGEKIHSGMIIDTSTKSGETGKKKWILYGIQIGNPAEPTEENEIWFNTFSKTLFQEAERMKGEDVTLFYTENDKGRTATAIVSADGIVRSGEKE